MAAEAWESIPGWFTFRAWYDRVAGECPPGSTLVELGVFCGKSLAYLAERTRGKGCRVVGVDTFLGSPEFREMVVAPDGSVFADMPAGHLAGVAVNHLNAAGVLKDVTLVVSDSARAAELFPDGSVWAAFVDAAHDADSVERDVRAWWPKVAPGGYLAGDDYDHDYPGVREGLLRAFPPDTFPPLPARGSGAMWFVQKGVAGG